MRWIATVTLVVLAGCGGGVEEQPGDAAVYDRISATDDCAELQAEFDQAMDNAEAREPGDEMRDISMAYAKAADARMEEVDCYDE